jgi:hypothetical protein
LEINSREMKNLFIWGSRYEKWQSLWIDIIWIWRARWIFQLETLTSSIHQHRWKIQRARIWIKQLSLFTFHFSIKYNFVSLNQN